MVTVRGSQRRGKLLCLPVVVFRPAAIMLGFGILLPVFYRLWEVVAGGCR